MNGCAKSNDLMFGRGWGDRPRRLIKPLAWLKRHPMPIEAFFRHCLVLSYALPAEVLRPLLPPGLTLDTLHGFGFVAIAMVQAESSDV
jgi:hypothetical protein